MQVGNKDNMAAISKDGQLTAKVLDEYTQDFQQLNIKVVEQIEVKNVPLSSMQEQDPAI